MNQLLHNISIRTRMLAILITFLIPIVIMGCQLNQKLQSAIDGSVAEYKGTEIAAPMLKLINLFADLQMAHIQKQSGDANADKNIADTTATIDQYFTELTSLNATLGADIGLTPAGLKKHGRPETLTIPNLKAQWDAAKATPAYMPETYRALIDDTIAIVAHVGDASGLLLDSDLDSYYIADASFNVFPPLIRNLTDLQQQGYISLEANDGKLDARTTRELDDLVLLQEKIYLPHVNASITTALREDANVNGTDAALQRSLTAQLATFNAAGKKVTDIVHALSKGDEMKPDDYVNAVDEMHDATGDFAKNAVTQLQSMLTERLDHLRMDRFKMIGFTSAIVGVAFVLFFIVSHSITGPIRHMTETMDTLASGDTSITIPSTDDKDEIGEMARAVLVFKENMIQTDNFRQEQEALKADAQRQKTITMNKMADDFESSVKTVVTSVSTSATQMRGNAERLNSLASQTKTTSASVASSATAAAQTATQVAAAAEELNAAIGEISEQVQNSSSVAIQATSQAESINEAMHVLVEKSNRVGEVIQFITSIASQINLLALNATIESARAGEAGRGFAVVASEVKNLANQTAKATEEIVQQVESMQEATNEAVQSVSFIISIINEISESTNGVAAAVEEQSAATKEISRNITQTATGTSEISRDIVTVEKGADETGISSRQVLDSATALTEQSELLNMKMNDFLKTIRAM